LTGEEVEGEDLYVMEWRRKRGEGVPDANECLLDCEGVRVKNKRCQCGQKKRMSKKERPRAPGERKGNREQGTGGKGNKLFHSMG
jgi:hypothetical protein